MHWQREHPDAVAFYSVLRKRMTALPRPSNTAGLAHLQQALAGAVHVACGAVEGRGLWRVDLPVCEAGAAAVVACKGREE